MLLEEAQQPRNLLQISSMASVHAMKDKMYYELIEPTTRAYTASVHFLMTGHSNYSVSIQAVGSY